jgi:HEPN domain-containing protein
MPREAARYAAQWLRIAEKDLTRVEQLLGLHDAEAAGFYLQQAVEKFLKAFLLSTGWNLKRIHDLEALLNAALASEPALETFRPACQTITGFYLIERYPDVSHEEMIGEITQDMTEADVRQALQGVSGLIDLVRRRMAS